MKRVVPLIAAGVLAWGGHLFRSQQYFLGVEGGSSHLESESRGFLSLRWGYYYYLPNPAQISGKLYLNLTNFTGVEGPLQSVEVWNQFLWNRLGRVKPYLGIGVGYLDKYRDGGPSFGVAGMEGGVLYYLTPHWDLFGGVKVTNGEGSLKLDTPLYRVGVGVDFIF